MTYDPAWDMPKVNWQQQGSYQQAITPLEYNPADEPLVCLPPINQYWLPLVLGCLDQLCNPSTWLVADESDLNAALEQAQLLKRMIGVRVECVSYAIRFDAATCQLQESTDGGITWSEIDGWDEFTACLPPQTLISYDDGCVLSESLDGGSTYTPVPGWIDNFSGCVQKYTPIIGLPPNPGDQPPDQLACSISTYLSEQVIIAAIGKAVSAISDDLTLLQFGLDVVNIIPEFVLVTLAADAFSAIYVAVQEGSLSDFEAALTDATLLQDIICAIYSCIVADGYVKSDNYDCIVASIGDITYAHPAVVSAIVSYVEALGPTALAQLSQPAGLEAGADCTSCGVGWCRTFDFTSSDYTFGTTAAGSGQWVPGTGWVSLTAGPYQSLDITAPPWSGANTHITTIKIEGSLSGSHFVDNGLGDNSFHSFQTFEPMSEGPFPPEYPCDLNIDDIRIQLDTVTTTGATVLSRLTLYGDGTPPSIGDSC